MPTSGDKTVRVCRPDTCHDPAGHQSCVDRYKQRLVRILNNPRSPHCLCHVLVALAKSKDRSWVPSLPCDLCRMRDAIGREGKARDRREFVCKCEECEEYRRDNEWWWKGIPLPTQPQELWYN